MNNKDQEHNKFNSGNVQDSIPFDLTFQILTKLPIKSLVKFQYVSKTWCSIIRSKYFSKSLVSSSQLLIYFTNNSLTNENDEKCLFFFTSQEDSSSSSLVANLDMKMISMDYYYYTRCASINGFICLSHKGRFMICNHNTKQVITLPEIADTNWRYISKYLGYDPINDQYKALCKKFSTHEDDQEHMVLTLGGDKPLSWRHIKGADYNYTPLTKGICINGFVYYGAWALQPHMRSAIVCFDVRSENLSFIKLPSTRTIDWGSTTTLINYKGKLAIVYFERNENVDLWVLQDGNEHKWSKCSQFLWHSLGDGPLSFQSTNNIGEIVIAPKFLPHGFQPFCIFYCNFESDQIRRVEIKGVADDDEDFRRRYGIENNGNLEVFISPEYSQNFTFL